MARLQSAVVLPEFLEFYLEAAQSIVLDSSLHTYRYLITAHLQTKTHDDFSHGALVPIIFEAIVRIHRQDVTKLQALVNAVLADVFEEIRGVAAFLAMKDEVLHDIRSPWYEIAVHDLLARFSLNTRAAALKDTPKLLLEHLRRSSHGLGRLELLKFKCKPLGPDDDEFISVGQKRAGKGNNYKHDNKRAKKSDAPTLMRAISQRKQKAQDAYIQRKINHELNAKQARNKD
ncbi:hypothetical protein DFH09DRAFT_1372239 [Mycena vulgaris]|nr:hypothetical protein DFH09DRAFT_1372239 [Mycena vulgaris]